jgi:hypothetical protein
MSVTRKSAMNADATTMTRMRPIVRFVGKSYRVLDEGKTGRREDGKRGRQSKRPPQITIRGGPLMHFGL